MRINVSPFRFVLCALALSVWSAPAFSQRIELGSEEKTVHSGAAESNATEHSDAKTHHDSSVTDWTHDHMLYPRVGPMDRLIALQKDPRAVQHWQESYRKDYVRWRRREGHHGERRNRSNMHPDWNIALGGSMDNATYASKWTFDSNESLTGAGPDAGACATDYLAVPIDPTGAGGARVGQPNIIGLNNLYSGTVPGPTGVCNRPGPPAGDDGVSATQYFSYTVIGDDGIVATSPVTSMDGNFIAFVEVGTVAGARFHVLAWKAGDGNTAGNRQDALTSSIQIPGTVPFATAQLVVGSGTATDLALGTATDSFSSPYVEYSDDVAYVGDDGGNIYKIKNVFCPAWAPCGGNAPSLDASFGTGGVQNVGAVCQVSGITVDGSGGNIYAGCSDGNLYAFTSTGTPVLGSPLAVGEGTGVQADGGIIDAPMLDVVNRWVYVETGDCTNTTLLACTLGNPILVQASMSNLGTNSVATLGPGGNFFNIHRPAFNDAYFSSGTAADWIMYEFASDNAGPTPPGGGANPEIVLYGITFGALHAMVGGPPANVIGFTGPGALEVSPLTEFLTTGGEDRLFASNLGPGPGNIVAFNITNSTNPPTGFPSTGTVESFNTQGTGTSGIIADNTDSAAGQANSIYFGPLGAVGTNPSTVVKLTQGDVSF